MGECNNSVHIRRFFILIDIINMKPTWKNQLKEKSQFQKISAK